MGNKNCTTWSSILFPENEEEDRINEWMKEQSPLSWENVPSFPGTEILPVQPVYKPDVRELQFRHEKEKALRKRSFLFIEKGSKNKSATEERRKKERNLITNSNNNVVETRQNDEVEEEEDEEQDKNYDQQQSTNRRFPTGRVFISLSHDPITRRIKVAIIKAKNLSCKQTEAKDKCGINCTASYIDVSLIEGEQLRQTRSTGIKKGYSEVLYYENFAFDTNNLDLRALSLEITAKHSNKQHFIKYSHDIGKVVLQGQMNDDVMIDSHLVEAIVHPGHTLYKWHTLWC